MWVFFLRHAVIYLYLYTYEFNKSIIENIKEDIYVSVETLKYVGVQMNDTLI